MKEMTLGNRVTKSVMERLGDNYEVEYKEVTKVNGVTYHGIVCRKENEVAAPVVYIDDLLSKYFDEEITEPEIVDEVLSRLEGIQGLDIDLKSVTSSDYISNNVEFQLLSSKPNSAYLDGVVSEEFLDLSCLLRCRISETDDGMTSFVVKEDYLKTIKISEEEMKAFAASNLKKEEFVIQGMSEFMSNEMGLGQDAVPFEEDNMFILTNASRNHGARILLRNDLVKGLADRLDCNLYILPSSIHEVLAIPDRGDVDVDVLRTMVREVNNTEVRPEEILSYSVYFFDKEKDEMRIA